MKITNVMRILGAGLASVVCILSTFFFIHGGYLMAAFVATTLSIVMVVMFLSELRSAGLYE